jgi:hypothetical protein
MRIPSSGLLLAALLGGLLRLGSAPTHAGELAVELGRSQGVLLVGAIRRWDEDGKARVPVDPKARIDSPRVDARAEREGDGRWVFRDIPEGRYDLVILAAGRIRVEGFHYPPLNEFDKFLPSDAQPPEEETRDRIIEDIAQARHYENKVMPLFLAGGDQQVRILVQLVRDQPTSFDGDLGTPAATVRHEIWQYTKRSGGWVKDRRTEVLDRLLMARREFRRWTWVWEPRLGGIAVGKKPVTLLYSLPQRFDPQTARGWFPNETPRGPD